MIKSTKKKLCIATTVLLASAAGSAAQAGIVTWNGGGANANWSTPGNWVGGNAPVAGDSLVFDGSVQVSNTNDFPANTNFAGITIASTASAMTLAGTAINLSGDINQNRATTSTISNAIALQQNINVAVPNAAATLTFGSGISGGFGITKTGPGLVVSNVAITQTGGLNVSGGTWRTGTSGNTTAILGTGAVTISNGATVELRSTTGTTFNNDLVLGTGGGFINERSNHTFSPASITGSGTLNLTASQTNLVFTATDFKGWNGTISASIGAGQTFGIRQATAFNNASMLNAVVNLGAGTNLTKQNGTNTTGIVVDIGTLKGDAGSSVGGSAAGTGYFTYSVGSRNEDSTFAGNMVDGSTKTALRKVGLGALSLTGAANTMSGPSAVNGGTLFVDGALTSAGLAMTVGASGTLGGTGSIAGSVTANGTLAPGHSNAGTLSVSNAMVMSATAILAYDLNGSNNAIGGGVNDLLTGITNLTLDGTLNVADAVVGSFSSIADGTTFRLINYTGTLTDNGLVLGTLPASLPAAGALTVDTSVAGQVNLRYNVIPEPSAIGLLALGLPMLSRRRRA